MAVDFSVEVIKGYQTQGVREEDNDYIVSFGVAGSLQEALKVSTAQLATWIKHDHGLNDSEVALFLGAVMKIEVTELVDPEFDVVTKVPKSAHFKQTMQRRPFRKWLSLHDVAAKIGEVVEPFQ